MFRSSLRCWQWTEPPPASTYHRSAFAWSSWTAKGKAGPHLCPAGYTDIFSSSKCSEAATWVNQGNWYEGTPRSGIAYRGGASFGHVQNGCMWDTYTSIHLNTGCSKASVGVGLTCQATNYPKLCLAVPTNTYHFNTHATGGPIDAYERHPVCKEC